MSHRVLFTVALLITVILAGLAPVAAAPLTQEAQGALTRLVHGIPEAPAVDVLIDGQPAAVQLGFTQATDHLRLAPGDHAVTVRAAGATLVETTLTVTPGQAMTVAIVGTAAAPEIQVFEDDLSPLVTGNVRVNAVHAAPGVGDIDVVLPDGSPVLQALTYGSSSGGIDIPANSYPLAIVPTGQTVEQALIPPADYPLRAGNLYRFMVVGGPTLILLESPVLPGGDSVAVRVAHAIEGAPAVDVLFNDVLLIPALKAGEITRHVALPLGPYTVTVRTAGEQNVAAIASLSLDLSSLDLAGQGRTIVVLDKGDTLSLEAYPDPVETLDPATSRVSVINAVPGATLNGSLTETEFTVPENTVFTTEVPAGAYSLILAADGGSALSVDALYNGGTLYSVLVTGTAQAPFVLFASAPLNFQPGSAIGLPAEAVAEQPEPAEPAAEEVVEPTEEVAEAAAVPTATPLPAPTEPPAPAAAPLPVATAPTEGTIGLVYNLNPGANLQLREYPRADARSLGLVTGGTVLSVLGRAGEPDFPAVPELAPGQDLNPQETWLLVEFTTVDGGTVTAWASAQFVQVTEGGKPVRLADLDPQSSDVPGTVSGAAAAAPTTAPVNAEFFAVVYNLNPDARLNIRRTPDVVAEVLAAVPAGTVLEPTGILEDLSWVFVTYRPEGGGEITGWASAEYVQFMFRGRTYLPTAERVAELIQRNLLTFVEPTLRGEVSADVLPTATPAPSDLTFFGLVYNLNPNANLNLRRTPDTLAEVLARLPAGTVIEPVAILEDFSWTYVIFRPEGGGEITGWVSTEFVQFFFRGRLYLPTAERITELIQRNLLRFADPTLQGEISAGASAAGASGSDLSQFRNRYVGTAVLDPGANLHLRRTPDAASESLALIPSGATMIVFGRTTDAQWLQVEYDATTGWVASAYVSLTLNGRRVRLEDLPQIQ